MLIYLGLILGVVIMIALVVRYDMYDREPWWMLLLAMGLGAAMMWSAFVVQHGLMLDWPELLEVRLYHALIAGAYEEWCKLVVVVAIVLLFSKHFNDPMDGLIYGAMAGLGAAALEGVWFLQGAKGQTAPLLGAEAVRLLMHTVWGGIAGFGLGLIVVRGRWLRAVLCGYVLAAALHVSWDYLVGFERHQTTRHTLIAAGLLLISFAAFGVMVATANKWSRERFDPQSRRRLLGPALRRLIRR